jgi:hypothetical protein
LSGGIVFGGEGSDVVGGEVVQTPKVDLVRGDNCGFGGLEVGG